MPNEYSCRLKSPNLFKDPWVRIKRKSKSVGKVYSVIRGTRKTTNKYEDQAYRYPKATWGAAEARKHCKGHKGSYEAVADAFRVDAFVVRSLRLQKDGYQLDEPERDFESEASILTRFASRIVNTPLMITQDKLNVILNVVGGRIGLDVEGSNAKSSIGARTARTKKKRQSCIAVVEVHDTLVHRSRGLSALSGLSTYEQIGKDFKEALKDSDVEGIIFDIDSPGGEVSGVFDLVDDIYNARGIKPIVAAVNDVAYSAAYAIASATGKVYVSRTGGSGSVGVIAVHVDQSKFNEKLGVKFTSIYAGAKKNSLSPHKEISAEAVKDVQTQVDEIYELFTKTVARNRNITQEEVKKTEAATYLGEKGIEVGLVDEILSWDQVLETFTLNATGGITMPGKGKGLKAALDEILKDIALEEVHDVFSEMGYVSEDVVSVLEADTENLRSELDALKRLDKEGLREAIKKEMDEEYRTKVRKEVEGDLQKDNGVLEALRNEVKQLKEENTETKKKQEKAEEDRRLIELESEIKDMGAIGDPKKHARTIFTLEKMNPELAKEHTEQLKVGVETLKAAGIFTEVGSTGSGGNGGGAFDKLKAIVEELKKGGLPDEKAWAKAARDNPKLYKEYREERREV